MMSKTLFLRRISAVMLTIIGFTIGYFNQKLSIYFLNKDALIGLLTAIILLYILYTKYLEGKIKNLEKSNEYQDFETEKIIEHSNIVKSINTKLSKIEKQIK